MRNPTPAEWSKHNAKWAKKLGDIEKLFRAKRRANAARRKAHVQMHGTKMKDEAEQRILRKWDELILQMRDEEMKMMECKTPADYASRQKIIDSLRKF